MMRTLLWKEYREHRAVWLLLALIAFLVFGGLNEVIRLQGRGLFSPDDLALFAIALVSMYGTALGALLIAHEREQGTLPFLDGLARQRLPLWATKQTRFG
jgi:hypothetical protein